VGDWDGIKQQLTRLEEEEDEAMGKVIRLRKQRQFLEKRRLQMGQRGLRFLDDLVAAEEKEARG
jgi:hypothetical protein